MGRYSTYIVTNKRRGTLYTGMTNSIGTRTLQHKSNANAHSFSSRYKLKRLVWYECFSTPTEAIRREKEIKGWKRNRKIALIEAANPEWKDLYGEIFRNVKSKYRKLSDDWHFNDKKEK